MGNASSSGIAPRAIRCDRVLALDELHHDRTHAATFLEAVDVRDVRVIDGRQRLRFAVNRASRSGRSRTSRAGPSARRRD
jgi:hypothetical protein